MKYQKFCFLLFIIFILLYIKIIYAQSYFNGYVRWQQTLPNVKSLEVGDVDGDKKEEIVAFSVLLKNGVSDKGVISIYQYDGKEMTREYISADFYPDPSWAKMKIGDIDSDGNNEIVVGLTNKCYIIKYEDEQYITKKDKSFSDAIISVAIGDIDNDSKSEILITTYSAPPCLYILDGNLDEKYKKIWNIWPYKMQIGDVDGDGNNEILSLTNLQYGINIYEFEKISNTMILEWSSNKFFYNFCVGDVNNDNKDEIATFEHKYGEYGLGYQKCILEYLNGTYVPIDVGSFGIGYGPTITISNIDKDVYNEIFYTFLLNTKGSESAIIASGWNGSEYNDEWSDSTSNYEGLGGSTVHHQSTFADFDNDGMNETVVLMKDYFLIFGNKETTDIDENHTFRVVENYYLYQNFPNPFNPLTTIKYSISKLTDVRLDIYNILGQEIKTLVDCEQEPGNYQIIWDGTNKQGMKVANGIYLYQIIAGRFIQTKKMVLLK